MKEYFAIGFTRQVGLMFLVYVGYLLFGSLCFRMLDTIHEQKAQEESVRTIILARRIVSQLRSSNFSDSEIENAFMDEKNERTQYVNSDRYRMYGNKVFFAFNLITTLGYGNVAPKCIAGQVVSIIYTMLGLPLHIMMMRLLSFQFRNTLRKLFKFTQSIYPDSTSLLFLAGAFFFLVWLLVFIFLPSYIFTITENRKFIESVYFSYVFLTTIGFEGCTHGYPRDYYNTMQYTLDLIVILIWIFFGMSFVSMTMNMLSYMTGVCMMDIVDCDFRKHSVAREKMKPLLELMKELNWQLVKYQPEEFHQWSEIKNFFSILTEHPEDVDEVMLRKMLAIVIDLKEKSYDQLSGLHVDGLKSEIPTTPVIKAAHDNLPEVLSVEDSFITISSSSLITVVSQDKPVTQYRGPPDKNVSSDNMGASSLDDSGKRNQPGSASQSPDWPSLDDTVALPPFSKDDDSRSMLDEDEGKRVSKEDNTGSRSLDSAGPSKRYPTTSKSDE